MIILSIIAVVIIFSLLVIAHEYGHFRAARRNGVEVEEFGIGFPPKLYGKKYGKTLYSINALPLGGFVRLKGEDGSEKGKGSFAVASFRAKTKIIMAGVVVNFLIAYVLFTILLIAGVPPLGSGLPSFGPIQPQSVASAGVTIFRVGENSAAQKAELKVSDVIVSIDGVAIADSKQLQSVTKANSGKTVLVKVDSNGQQTSKQILLGSDVNAGILGVSAERVNVEKYSWWAAPIAALVLMVQLVIATLGAFGELLVGLFSRGKVSDQVAGPIGIVSVFTSVMSFGWRYVALFVASISLSLAVINALPLPALDGGRQMMLILRKAGLKITPERENLIHVIGFFALIGLMIIIGISDISRL